MADSKRGLCYRGEIGAFSILNEVTVSVASFVRNVLSISGFYMEE